MKKIFAVITLLALSLFAQAAPLTIQGKYYAGFWPIVIKTCDSTAQAICSLTWRDKEFVNNYDHGRQIQSASSFDYLGENFNPTEAGASYLTDGFIPSPSSSLNLRAVAAGNKLVTQTQMAFWNPVNGVRRSNHIHQKWVTIGMPGMNHVIQYITEFTVPMNESHSYGQFEVLTGYMPPEFSKFYTFDVKNRATTVVPLDDGPGEQDKPVIMSTPDGGWAMGVYSPDSPQQTYPTAGYGRWRHHDTVKWNNVFRIPNPAGTYRFKTYIAVGSLENVRVSIQQIHDNPQP